MKTQGELQSCRGLTEAVILLWGLAKTNMQPANPPPQQKKKERKIHVKNLLGQPFKAIQGTKLYAHHKFGCHDTK